MGLRSRLASALFRALDPEVSAALPDRGFLGQGTGSVRVDADTAMRSSAVWACIRLRANLVSSMPIDVFRRVGGIQVEVPKPPLLVDPSPHAFGILEWLYSSQTELDRYGNSFGIIRERDALGFPKRVDLIASRQVKITGKGAEIKAYAIGQETYDPKDIWHERQYTVPGSPVGLCPITYAAWTIGGYLSAQKFGNDYFQRGGAPTGTLQNTKTDKVGPLVDEAKERFRAATESRDIFVVGKDWEWTPSSAPEAAAAFLEEMKFGAADVCRFFGVPATMVDAGVAGSAITYANVTQQNLQFLITEIGPLLSRREAAFTRALPAPRYVKFNADALLRLDPETRQRVILSRVAGKTLAPSEARELDNLPPFTPAQLEEFATLSPAKPATPSTNPSGSPA